MLGRITIEDLKNHVSNWGWFDCSFFDFLFDTTSDLGKIFDLPLLEKAVCDYEYKQYLVWLLFREEFVPELELHKILCNYFEWRLDKKYSDSKDDPQKKYLWEYLKVKRMWIEGRTTEEDVEKQYENSPLGHQSMAFYHIHSIKATKRLLNPIGNGADYFDLEEIDFLLNEIIQVLRLEKEKQESVALDRQIEEKSKEGIEEEKAMEKEISKKNPRLIEVTVDGVEFFGFVVYSNKDKETPFISTLDCSGFTFFDSVQNFKNKWKWDMDIDAYLKIIPEKYKKNRIVLITQKEIDGSLYSKTWKCSSCDCYWVTIEPYKRTSLFYSFGFCPFCGIKLD